MTEPNDRHPLGRAAAFVIALTGLWLLAGAVFKLFWGSPNLLPQVVRDVPLALGTTYRLAIAAELVLAMLALFKPKWGWPLLVGALLLFDVILTTQISAGAENCGCFGNKLSISPWVMLAIDSALLLGILATRPWSSLSGKGLPAVPTVILAAALASIPWLYNREVAPAAPEGGGETTENGGGEAQQGGYLILDLDSWVGKDLSETELADYMDVYATPPDATWIIYRATCDHCAEHLSQLTDSEIGQRYLVLCQLKEAHDTDENRSVHRMPEGDFVTHVEMPDTIVYVVTTPGELDVEGFVVVRGEQGVPVDGH